MPHSLKLAFKDAPTTGDDFINLNFLSADKTNPAGTVGVELLSYSEGEIADGYRELSLVLNIEGSSRDDVIARYRQIKRYGQQTRMYFKRFSGDDDDPTTPVKLPLGLIPARLDGSWQQGNAAVLTFKADGATKEVYWNVVDYKLSEPDYSLVTSQYSFNGINLTLVVEAGARGARVILDNLIHGDFAPPFATSGTAQVLCGYTLGAAAWTQDTTNGKFGLYCLKVVNSATTTTSTESRDISTDNVLASCWIKGTIGSGTLIVKLQGYNGAWVDIQTIASLTSATISTSWTPYVGTLQSTGGYTRVRLSFTGTASCTVYFDGAAIWKNPVGGTVPTEYVSSGRIVGAPSFNVYNVQGDMAAPVQLWQGLAIGNAVNQRLFITGCQNYDPSFESPIPAMAVNMAGGATDATMFFGALGTVSSGSSATSNYNQNASAPVYPIDYRNRLYRAFLVYAANDSAVITSVKLTIGVTSKLYTLALPQTYIGAGAPINTQYRVYDLGDYFFRRPGSAWEETTSSIGSSFGVQVSLTHSTNAARQTAVSGVILLPAAQFGAIDIVTPSTQALVATYDENGTPVAGYNSTVTSSAGPVQDLTFFVSTATLTGGEYYLIPNGNGNSYTCNRLDMLVLANRDSTYSNMYSFDASATTYNSIRYSPRYSSGVQ